MKYIVGIDGGGTKTVLTAYSWDGANLGTAVKTVRSPGINYNFTGVDKAVQNLICGIKALELPANSIVALGIGDPSCDDYGVSENAKLFIKMVSKESDAPVFLRSDAYMTLLGLRYAESEGILIISGTGSIGIGETKEGKTHIVGGWGRLTGDEGSGYYIGLEGIRAALHAADGIAAETALLDAALSYFNVKAVRDLAQILCDEPNVAGFSVEVSRCAKDGDETARAVLNRAAKYLSGYACALLDKCGGKVVGVYGSVLKNDIIVRNEFDRILKSRDEHIRVVSPSITPEEAAARYAAREIK